MRRDVLQAVPGKDRSGKKAIPRSSRSKGGISVNQETHLRLRKLANKAFLPKHLLGLTARIQGLANEILDQALSKGSVRAEVPATSRYNEPRGL